MSAYRHIGKYVRDMSMYVSIWSLFRTTYYNPWKFEVGEYILGARERERESESPRVITT